MTNLESLRRESAVRVMGWRRISMSRGKLRGCPLDSDSHDTDAVVPDYPRDISVAWMVVEEMKQNGYTCEVSVSTMFSVPVVSFATDTKLGVEYECETVSEAICRAALKALAQ